MGKGANAQLLRHVQTGAGRSSGRFRGVRPEQWEIPDTPRRRSLIWPPPVGAGTHQIELHEAAPTKKPQVKISDFDRFAGKLWHDAIGSSKEHRVSPDQLLSIAVQLDERGFKLREHLEPCYWQKISLYNKQHCKAAIKTWIATCDRRLLHGKALRGVRHRLSRAGDKYRKLQRTMSPMSA